MGILRKQQSCNGGYSRIEEWDREERMHREAQFLIYKTLQKVDEIAASRSSTCLIRLRFCKMKIKVGRRLKRLKRGVISSLSKAKASFSTQLPQPRHLKGWPWRSQSRSAAAAFRLPTPLLA